MNEDPIIGPARAGLGCAHAITLDHQTCDRTPVVHIATFSDVTGLVELASCRRHASLARITADFIAEHPYGAQCDEGGCWPINAEWVVPPWTTLLQPRRVQQVPMTRPLTWFIWFWGAIAVLLMILGVANVILLSRPQ